MVLYLPGIIFLLSYYLLYKGDMIEAAVNCCVDRRHCILLPFSDFFLKSQGYSHLRAFVPKRL